jgi:transcriptional regulator with XRE-family HTH domain
VPKVAEVAGIGNQTIYRWRDGDWTKVPSPDAVLAFCDALDIDPKHAFGDPLARQDHERPPPEPAPLDRDIELLARKLRDPRVPRRRRSPSAARSGT